MVGTKAIAWPCINRMLDTNFWFSNVSSTVGDLKSDHFRFPLHLDPHCNVNVCKERKISIKIKVSKVSHKWKLRFKMDLILLCHLILHPELLLRALWCGGLPSSLSGSVPAKVDLNWKSIFFTGGRIRISHHLHGHKRSWKLVSQMVQITRWIFNPKIIIFRFYCAPWEAFVVTSTQNHRIIPI